MTSLRVLTLSKTALPNTPSAVIFGGGVRVWALAQGLIQHGITSHIAVPRSVGATDDQIVHSYGDFDELISLAATYDFVISNISTDESQELFSRLPRSVIRIADAFIPVHLEISASTTGNSIEFEELKYKWGAETYLANLASSDISIVASDTQRKYLVGLLSGSGILSPKTYGSIKIAIAPIGVDLSTSIAKPAGEERVILWWGGFYPWYDFERLFEFASRLYENEPKTTFRIVGAINPFTSGKLFETVPLSALTKLTSLPNVESWDWLPYADRAKAFEGVTAVLILNGQNFENEFSWRTRFVDPVGFGVPIITNGGDPFGELLIAGGGALRVPSDPIELAQWITNEMKPELEERARAAMLSIREKYSWRSSAEALATFLRDLDRSEVIAARASKVPLQRNEKSATSRRGRIQQARAYLETEGALALAKKSLSFLWKTLRPQRKGTTGAVVILLHQLDKSGAPFIGLALNKFLIEAGRKTLILVSGLVESDLLEELHLAGQEVHILSGEEPIHDLLTGNDVVINSAAVPTRWISDALLHQKKSSATTVFYIHESSPEIYIGKKLAKRIKTATGSGLRIFAPNAISAEKVSSIYGLNLPVEVEGHEVSAVSEVDCDLSTDSIRAVLVGLTLTPLKRHSEVLTAFAMATAVAKGPQYRPLHLTLIGVGGDPIGDEITRIAESLGESITILPKSSKELTTSLLAKSNVAISLAPEETFALYLAVAMQNGAVVLRVRTGGFEEQVEEGVNGFELDGSVGDLSDHLVLLADRQRTSDSDLAMMMKHSQEIARSFSELRYSHIVQLLS